MKIPSKEQIEIAANNHIDLQYPMGVERDYPLDDFRHGAYYMERQLEPIITDLEMENLRLKKALKVVKNYLSTKTVEGFEAYTIVEQALK